MTETALQRMMECKTVKAASAAFIPRETLSEPEPEWGPFTTSTLRFFLSRLALRAQLDPVTHCWIWTGAVQSDGYGSIQFAGRVWLVHRLSYQAFVDPDLPD